MIIISAIVLFLIIYFAVRLAINPLLHQHKDHNPDNYEGDLVKLRDMDILSNYELEEIAELYEKNKKSTADYEQYQRYEKALRELAEIKYFDDEQLQERIEKLKAYFIIE